MPWASARGQIALQRRSRTAAWRALARRSVSAASVWPATRSAYGPPPPCSKVISAAPNSVVVATSA